MAAPQVEEQHGLFAHCVRRLVELGGSLELAALVRVASVFRELLWRLRLGGLCVRAGGRGDERQATHNERARYEAEHLASVATVSADRSIRWSRISLSGSVQWQPVRLRVARRQRQAHAQ
jgi:hypothetical protein